MVPTQVNLPQVAYNEIGFMNADSLPDGIFAIGCAKKPLDVAGSVRDATGMALKAIQPHSLFDGHNCKG
jgi:heterodisulfide reductase subunit A-like polyferredoxin